MNLDTLRTPYHSSHRATLKGWRRLWVSSETDRALLSVERCPESRIEGLVISDSSSSLSSLDARESGYSRHELSPNELEWHDPPLPECSPPECQQCFLYICDSQEQGGTILRSYLDAVAQGYLRQFGESGLRNFVSTTRNFDIPITEDRASPRYPRSVSLSADEKILLDNLFPIS